MTIGLAIALVGHAVIAPVSTRAQVPPAPQFGAPAVRYRVVVPSADFETLQQVRQVAKGAFIQTFADNVDRIQAGAFAGEISARARVDALARQGIRAVAYNTQGQAVYQALAAGTATSSFNSVNSFQNNQQAQPATPAGAAQAVTKMPKGYYAIVPVDRDQMGITFEAFRKLGIAEEFITIGQQRRGWHVAVGVYPSRSGAETMSQYLRRKGGFDARAYYER
ncbi:hypothetical protein IQ266_01415 [filamentous cyanobacterium LEGE 11480]|uniref:SPOR domain-containing protein n=1 Tax=Romeriopsis navalis LEGE 11480 TaxID=2777977 RepID=A0A928Z1V7_9CYAN|nr:hypothetical protein [Romeriopsis navalis]MBE9028412.1 hypothetical protein [Romeriopsis navalis LEGE 11480]